MTASIHRVDRAQLTQLLGRVLRVVVLRRDPQVRLLELAAASADAAEALCPKKLA
jgi:hypothetical protein